MVSMREYPWLQRELSWEDQRRFELLHARWELTCLWVEDLKLPPVTLHRKGVTVGLEAVQPILKHWEAMRARPQKTECIPVCINDELLGSLLPAEALEKLALAVRVQQALVLDQILRKNSELRLQLARLSHEAGKLYRKNRFRAVSSDWGLGELHAALVQGPFSCTQSMHPEGVLVERATVDRIEWLELECPHRDSLLEVGPVADSLCQIHNSWREGFIEGDSGFFRGVVLETQKHCRFCMELAR